MNIAETKALLREANKALKIKRDNRKRTDCEEPLYIKPLNMDAYDLFKFMEKDNLWADAIITDPPYNVSRPNNFTTIGRTGIDFGAWDKDFDITG
jgi:DNA modification methylase